MCTSRSERLLVAAALAVAVAVAGQRAAADIFCVNGTRPALVRRHVARTVDGAAAANLLRRLTPTRGSCTTCHLAPGPESLLQPNTPALWPFTAYGRAGAAVAQ